LAALDDVEEFLITSQAPAASGTEIMAAPKQWLRLGGNISYH
jgi:hypothetical protein